MYEFIETTTGWMVCWGPVSQTQPEAMEEVKEIETKSKHEELPIALMAWEVCRI